MLKYIRSLLVSQYCILCEKDLIQFEELVCLGCMHNIPSAEIHNLRDNELFYRLAGKVKLDGAFSPFLYEKEGSLQKLIQLLKYKNLPQLGSLLGQLLATQLVEVWTLDTDFHIIPVPLHPKRKRERGYNQALEIAKGMHKVLGLPINQKYLSRKKSTHTQTRKTGSDRWKNVALAFKTNQETPAKIMLVDDVVTTGSTMEACIRVCCQDEVQPEEIIAVSVGMARK